MVSKPLRRSIKRLIPNRDGKQKPFKEFEISHLQPFTIYPSIFVRGIPQLWSVTSFWVGTQAALKHFDRGSDLTSIRSLGHRGDRVIPRQLGDRLMKIMKHQKWRKKMKETILYHLGPFRIAKLGSDRLATPSARNGLGKTLVLCAAHCAPV